MKCRHCQAELDELFLDLGSAPPSNAYLAEDDLSRPELHFPLRLRTCTNCWLVQTEDYAEAEALFSRDYAYFSSVSTSWLAHAKGYAESISRRLGLGDKSLVIELASNDGYLLKNFVATGVPCLGIEPTDSTAAAAEAIGVPVLREFFSKALGRQLAEQGRTADLVIGNNVYAHVPDINDFTAGIKAVLKPGGTVTLEFPHLMNLIEQTQFDTVYHEHFSYLSLHTVGRIFATQGLRVFDVEALATHGGSLRIYGCHQDDARLASGSIASILSAEANAGLRERQTYRNFQRRAETVKDALLEFLIAHKRAARKVAAYGAAAKGNTLLNFAGVRSDLLPYVCDAAVSKQGRYMPGSRIPILSPEVLRERKPDIVLILPWNIADEVVGSHAYVREWGGKFVVAVPRMEFVQWNCW
jgi:SAM-dependent methyltransferase